MTRRTEHSRITHNIRRKARRHFIDALYAKQNSLCWWCKSACVIVANIPEDDRISESQGFMTWQDGEQRFSAKVATVDHLQPIREDGGNDEGNLVMACGNCNKDRTKQTQIRMVCSQCSGPLDKKRTGKCTQCRIDSSKKWLKDHGWNEVRSGDEPTHTKFIDPQTGESHILRYACEMLNKRLGT